jgi:hypothetical protein
MSSKRRRKGEQTGAGNFAGCLRQLLTPELFKQARSASGGRRCRWEFHPLLLILLSMTWCAGESTPERFEVARGFYVALCPKRRRPGKTHQGFLKALDRLPCCVLRLVASAIRARLLLFGAWLHTDGWVVFGCDGTALACPRTDELEQRLASAGGRKGKLPDQPQVGLTALVHLASGLLWSWRLGRGKPSERDHLESLLPTLPERALVVADCGFQGYELACSLASAGVAFLIRVSSLTTFYLDEDLQPGEWRDGLAWYWPQKAQKQGLKPLRVRLLRVSDPDRKNDVWLVTAVLSEQRLSLQQAGRFYKMRWGSETFFRAYKRTLGKVKLVGRTVRQVHREAEGSLLAVQLLLAQAAQARLLYGHKKDPGSVRTLLVEVRREIRDLSAGKRRGRKGYQKRLAQAQAQRRQRTSAKMKRRWPSRGDHKPPKPPKLRVLTSAQKALLHLHLPPI